MFANLDGFRCYKVKNRGDYGANDRLYIAPVYVIGLPGDVEMLNKELEPILQMLNKPNKVDEDKERKMLKGECLEEDIGDSCCKEKI